MAEMSQREIEEHLTQTRIGHLVTLRANGSPHVAPVWFRWRRGRVTVMAGKGAVKVRNVGRNPQVALSVATEGRPYRYVVLEGEASLTKDDLAAAVRSICLRYDGPQRGEAFAQELLDRGDMVLLEIRVDRVMSWVDDE